MKKLYLLLGMLTSVAAVAGSAIDVQQMSPDSYLLTYRGDRSISVDNAQEILYRPAVEVCAGYEPVYGRYKQKHSAAMSTRAPGRKEMFLFVQEIRCPYLR